MKALGNWRTSASGTMLGILGWWAGVGFKVPETKQEWAMAVGSILVTVFGLSAKDGMTGSAPGSEH